MPTRDGVVFLAERDIWVCNCWVGIEERLKDDLAFGIEEVHDGKEGDG